ncbi:AMP-binding protein [Nocardioides daphniae]|uniref:ATP-dependent acyl-CoA ligase n=1 Tax=Nocardioides daphniae TaxID=402297 RepID=A0A4P7U8P9_9ACTN|nr:AMP-binding protein [Nocardioides daphniae]QCC76460.1 ATP-dependent acyl-CoA ligase [Nocardioides daphniae]GGD06566.1 ATP-dependent acyl-CoA ligase [Nocardioides daphniae]
MEQKKDLSLGDWLAEVAADPRRGAAEVVVEDERVDARALDADASRVASGLLRLGLTPGDRVAVLTPACVGSLQAWFGIARAGLVEVPLNPAAGSVALAHCLVRSRVRAVVCDAELVPLLRSALAEVGPGGERAVVEHLVLMGEGSVVGAEVPGLRTHAFADLLAATPGEVAGELPVVDPGSTAVVLYTSGTTGPPKGVRLTHRANVNLARHTVELMGYTAADRLYSVFPLYHSNARYCSVMAGLEAGAGVLLHRRFTASGFWQICRREGITAFNYQGAMMSILEKQPRWDDDCDNPVRVAFGAPCPAEIFEVFEERFDVRLTEIYGSTEVSLVCEMPPQRRRVGTAGQESPLYRVAVVDELDQPVPTGTPGEIVARPKAPGWMFSGYEGDPAATVEAWRNLWFHTGDRGVLDEDGFLTFLDRVKDTVRRRGENVSTWEVERVIAEHDGVAQVAAYGVTSELSEEDVMVAVVPAPGVELDPAALVEHCDGRLTAFAVPRYVRLVEELPLTPSQRVEKYKLKAEGVVPGTWDREAR